MNADASLKRLLAVLTERDIGLGYDDLAWLFESPQSKDAMISWVHEYLTPATLLTPEELEACSTLPPLAPNLKAANEHDAAPRPLEEPDFENAINTLEASTAAIEKQCAILEAQREALKELQAQNQQYVPSIPDNDQKLQSRARTKVQLNLETEELTDTIKQRLTTAQRHAETTVGSLRTYSQRQLDKDDRLLDGLQKIMSKIGTLDCNDKHIPDFDTLARALVKLEGKCIKDRTNAVYLTALQQTLGQDDNAQAGYQQEGQAELDQEALELTEELESLITEVDSVLEMTINTQHRAPIVDSLRLSDAQSRKQRQQWLRYVKTTLGDMSEKLQELAACTHETLAHATAVNHISSAFTETLPPPNQTRPKLERSQSSKAQSSKKSLKPFLHRVNPNVSKDPTLEMLGYHGIRIPLDIAANNETVSPALQSTIQERRSRLQALHRSTEQTVVAQVAESVNVADGQLEILLQALYAYTSYGTVNLADRGVKDRLSQLERDISGLAEGMRRLDGDRLAEAERKKLHEALG